MASYSGLPNKEYWTERLKTRFQEVEDIEGELLKSYTDAYEKVLNEYTSLLKPFKKAGGGYNWHRIQDSVFYDVAFNVKVSRFQSMLDRIEVIINTLGTTEQRKIELLLIKTFQDNYYDIFYQMELASGYQMAFTNLNPDRLRQIVHTHWTPDGIEFSDRIWKHKEKLTSNLKGLLEDAIKTGESPRLTAKKLKEATGNTYYNARRVIRTETTALIAESDVMAYGELGFDELEYNATFDSRTSEICGKLDGTRIKRSEAVVGQNIPPAHPNCRSTIEPIIPGEYIPPYKYGKNGLGDRVKIPMGMSFEEFKHVHEI